MVGKFDSIRAAGGEAGRTGVRAVPDQSGYLHEVIHTITSGPDLEGILGGVVRVVTEATGCHACFISLLQEDHLVVRAASGRCAELEKNPMAACGAVPEWVAKTRRSVLIPGSAPDDPRVVRIPELDPERLHSLASVPISSQAGDAIGTITLHAEAPHRFCQADLDFLERVAGLVAAAVDNARLYTEATSKDALVVGLSGLAEQIAECKSVDEILARMPANCRTLLGATRCEVYLLDGEQRLVLRAADPARPAEAAFDTRSLWLEVVSGRRLPARAPHATPVPENSDAVALAQILWGEGLTETPLFAPLVVRGELLGLLAVLVPLPTSPARRAFSAAASIAAIAIRNERLQEDDLVRDFFEVLGSTGVDPEDVACRAAKLRIDPEVSHVALHAAPWPPPLGERRSRLPPLSRSLTPLPPWSTIADEIVGRLLEALPGAVLDRRQGSVRGFLKAAPPQLTEILKIVRLVHDAVTARTAVPCSIGLSGLCRGPEAFQHGLHQAIAAAEVGALIRGAPGVFTHEDLGPYGYLLSAEVPDCCQQALEALAHHDRDRGSRLFDTLESYLDNKGNIVGTSRALGIHQNTLRQRLTRIERVGGLNPDQEDWLSMAMALKVVKLRLLRARAQEQYGPVGGADLALGGPIRRAQETVRPAQRARMPCR